MEAERVSPRTWATLVVLGLIYILSFIDRFILALLVGPLKADLGLSDLQLGLLFGTFFAIFYGLLGLPLARFADRRNRKWLIVAGVVFWSACTVGSAFAQNYATLAILRFGLAAGEAALTPAAMSLLADAFPPHRRMLAGTLYTAFGMIGSSTAFAVGAGVLLLTEAIDIPFAAWRAAFVIVGVPGFLLAAVLVVLAREPRRSGEEASVAWQGVLRFLRDNRRLYGGLFAGAGSAQMMSYAMVAWSPALLQRSYGLDIKLAGAMLGGAQVIAFVGGTLVVPMAVRAIAMRSAIWGGRAPVMAATAGMILIILSLQMPHADAFLAVSTFGGFLLTGGCNSIVVLMQSIAPAGMRATLTAVLMIFISSIGLGIGPPVAAAAAAAGGSDQGLAFGLSLLGFAALGLLMLFFGMAARPLGRTLTVLFSPVDAAVRENRASAQV